MAATIPVAPNPADGVCATQTHQLRDGYNCVENDSLCLNVPWNQYYYTASGSATTISQVPLVKVYSDYAYYFCIGQQTGDIGPGPKSIAPNNKDLNIK